MPEESLRYAPVIDFVARKEFDLAVVAVAEGRAFADVKGISYRPARDGGAQRGAAAAHHEQLDALPFVTEVYERDLDYLKYNSPTASTLRVALHGARLSGALHLLLWPQVTTGPPTGCGAWATCWTKSRT